MVYVYGVNTLSFVDGGLGKVVDVLFSRSTLTAREGGRGHECVFCRPFLRPIVWVFRLSPSPSPALPSHASLTHSLDSQQHGGAREGVQNRERPERKWESNWDEMTGWLMKAYYGPFHRDETRPDETKPAEQKREVSRCKWSLLPTASNVSAGTYRKSMSETTSQYGYRGIRLPTVQPRSTRRRQLRAWKPDLNPDLGGACVARTEQNRGRSQGGLALQRI